jgi:hypothetical protein
MDIECTKISHPDGDSVVFVETPYFDDASMSDMMILGKLAEFFATA